jgi:hypothetical protein
MSFRHFWTTFDYIHEPKSPFWYLFWGFILGGSLIYAILSQNFLFAIILVIGLIFIFYSEFQKPKILYVELDDKKIKINDEIFNLNDYYCFSIFKIRDRFFLEIYPKSFFKKEIHIAIPEHLVENIRKDLLKIIKERKQEPRILTSIFRHLWP